jgi:hypothetical protein
MGVIGSNAGVSFDPSDSGGAVFGTFGVQYDTSEYERTREDGSTVMGLSPDCRVFIYGADITADVSDVSVTNSISNGNKCEITIANPRGRYEITKQDLMGKWREDKDVLSTYTYPELKRVSQKKFESFMDNMTTAAFGKEVSTGVKQGMNLLQKSNSFLGNPYGLPAVRGITRQIFETKFFSGITKNSGDVVFDYRDPVVVFFKGRFAPFWYFGFTGIVAGWDDSDAYQQDQVIKIRCEDILSLWKRSRFMQQASIFPFSRREDRIRSSNKSSAFNFMEDIAGAVSFSDLVKLAAYSWDYSKFAYNCHISKPGRYVTQQNEIIFSNNNASSYNLADSQKYKEVRGKLTSEALIDSGVFTPSQNMTASNGRYMFTGAGSLLDKDAFGIDATGEVAWNNPAKDGTTRKSIGGSAGGTGGTGLIDVKKIMYVHSQLFGTTEYRLNSSPFGPSTALYTQFNEIEFPYGTPFTGKNLKSFLDVSVRYWEAKHRIREDLSSSQNIGTGWVDNKAFGICGVHPALTYDFIGNFATLDNIWEQCYKDKTGRDKLIMSPNDKIRSMVAGEPTEMIGGSSGASSGPVGTAFNLFRPRLFVVLPRRFSDRVKAVGPGAFGKFEMFKTKETTVFDYLTKTLRGVEYVLYSSPAGDIFIEPELYDFHPLEFSGKIDKTNIVQKQIPVKFRTRGAEKETLIKVQHDAYFFNPKANHPFFLTEKDRVRVTQTFDHKLIHTSVLVTGGQTKMGGIMEVVKGDMLDTVTGLTTQNRSQGNYAGSNFQNGEYIADGYQRMLDQTSPLFLARSKRDQALTTFKKASLNLLMTKYKNATVEQAVNDFFEIMYGMDDANEFFVLFGETAQKLTDEVAKEDVQAAKNPKTAPSQKNADTVFALFFSELTQHRNTQISALVGNITQPNKDQSGKDSTKKSSKSIIGEWGLSGSGFDAYMEVVNNTTVNEGNTVLAKLVELAGPLMIGSKSEQNDKEVTKRVQEFQKSFMDAGGGISSGNEIRSQSDEKEAARKGIYNPSEDMIKLYGYTPTATLSNPYISNKDEVYDYARTVFNRLKGKAFQLKIDSVGRPEFCLNRPYYCERKDAIGLLADFGVQYSHGQDFSSSSTLEYVRKNSITYDYVMGDLDPIMPSDHNKSFKKQADYYYLMNRPVSKLGGIAASATTDAIAGESPGFGRALGASTVGGLVGSAINSFTPLGGIFVAHNRIGHIPFDSRFGENSATESAVQQDNTSDKSKNKNQSISPTEQPLYDLAKAIKAALDGRDDIEDKKLVKAEEELLSSEIERDTKQQLVDNANEKKSDGSATKKEREQATKEYSLALRELSKAKALVTANTTIVENFKEQVNVLNKTLYGEIKEPSNLTDRTKNAFKVLRSQKSDDKSMSPELAETISNGLFYMILSRHYTVYKDTKVFSTVDDLELTEKPEAKDKKTFGGESIDYYVKVKPPSGTGTATGGIG